MTKKKIIIGNFLVFFALLIILELILGDWFSKYNFGYHMRDKRLVNYSVNTVIGNDEFNFKYIRNYFGFRMDYDVEPKEIKILFQGGSTGDEMPLPYEKTIVGNLNKYLKSNGKDYNVVNASLSGKSTAGYNNDFKYWFPRLKSFNPRIIIFFSGHNDADILFPYKDNLEDFELEIENKTYSNKLYKKIYDYITNNSFVLIRLKKIKDKYFDSEKHKVLYDLNKDNLYENFSIINYKMAKSKFQNQKINKLQQKTVEFYRYNLSELKKNLILWKITPIFVTQVRFNGISTGRLFLINEETKRFCAENNYRIIKLDEFYEPDHGDYFDFIHTTPKGSTKIANFLYPLLEDAIEELSKM